MLDSTRSVFWYAQKNIANIIDTDSEQKYWEKNGTHTYTQIGIWKGSYLQAIIDFTFAE